MTTTKEKLKRFFSLFSKNSKVLVVINADPDAIAGAMAIRRLLWRRAAEVGICCFNRITRPDNLAMIELTESGLVHLSDIRPEDFNVFIIIDSQPDHHEQFARFRFDAVIDHHPVSAAEGITYTDIRPFYGACSTILTEYLRSRKIRPSAKLAAALMLGIKTDTADFTRGATLKDIKAFQYLYQFADNNIVTKVERAMMTEEDLDFLAKAIRYRRIVSNRVFFHAGRISRPDELVMTADFFLTLSRVNWSIISGVCDQKLIIVIRNDGLRKSAGNTAKEAFSMFGSAGGHKTMARAELDMKRVRRHLGRVSKKSLAQWIESVIEKTAGKKIE